MKLIDWVRDIHIHTYTCMYIRISRELTLVCKKMKQINVAWNKSHVFVFLIDFKQPNSLESFGQRLQKQIHWNCNGKTYAKKYWGRSVTICFCILPPKRNCCWWFIWKWIFFFKVAVKMYIVHIHNHISWSQYFEID